MRVQIILLAVLLLSTQCMGKTLSYHLFRPKHVQNTLQHRVVPGSFAEIQSNVNEQWWLHSKEQKAAPEVAAPAGDEMLKPEDVKVVEEHKDEPQKEVAQPQKEKATEQGDKTKEEPIQQEVIPAVEDEEEKQRDIEERGVDPKSLPKMSEVDLSQSQKQEHVLLSTEVEVLDPKIKKIDLKIAEADMLESWNPVSDSNELLPPDDFVDDYVERKRQQLAQKLLKVVEEEVGEVDLKVQEDQNTQEPELVANQVAFELPEQPVNFNVIGGTIDLNGGPDAYIADAYPGQKIDITKESVINDVDDAVKEAFQRIEEDQSKQTELQAEPVQEIQPYEETQAAIDIVAEDVQEIPQEQQVVQAVEENIQDSLEEVQAVQPEMEVQTQNVGTQEEVEVDMSFETPAPQQVQEEILSFDDPANQDLDSRPSFILRPSETPITFIQTLTKDEVVMDFDYPQATSAKFMPDQ